MRGLRFLCASVGSVLLSSLGTFTQERTVAVTVDDLPYAGESLTLPDFSTAASTAEMVNRKLLTAFKAHHVPVTGFVVQKGVESLGSRGTRILQAWISHGFDLGNHTYSHPDINDLATEQVEEEIVRGEKTFGRLMKAAGKKPAFLRFPMNHTGDTKSKHDAIAAFLAQRGYRVATCTIDNSDYLFNGAYTGMLAKHNPVAAQKVRLEYLSYTSAEIDYYAALNKQVFGYEPPQVMLMHDNRLNADVVEQLLALFVEKHYKFVSLDTAQLDAAYQTPETYITRFGPMWGYRWAKERHVRVDGSLEPDPPTWILEYGKSTQPAQ